MTTSRPEGLARELGGNEFEESEIFKMNGLRVYVNPVGAETLAGNSVFYSRRGDGPYYRWRYEEELRQWRSSRVSFDVTLKALCMASWKAVPTALQARLDEHYLD